MQKVFMSLSSLLMDPNPDDPLRSDAANLFKKDLNEYEVRVREDIEKYAK